MTKMYTSTRTRTARMTITAMTVPAIVPPSVLAAAVSDNKNINKRENNI